MVVKQSEDSVQTCAFTSKKTISLERLSDASSSTLTNLENMTASPKAPTIVGAGASKSAAASNKKLFENFLTQKRIEIKRNGGGGGARTDLVVGHAPFHQHQHRLLNNSSLSLNEELTFELINAKRNKTVKSRNDEHESCLESSVGGVCAVPGIVQKSLPDLNCVAGFDKSSSSSAAEESSGAEDQVSLNDDEIITSSSLSTSSSGASEAAQSSSSSGAESHKHEEMPFESASVSSSAESTRYLSSDESSADYSSHAVKSASSPSASPRQSAANNTNVSDEDEDAVVFSDMTVIIDRADFLNSNVTDDDELDEYSSRRETVTFAKIVFNDDDEQAKASSEEPDMCSAKSDEKSLSNFLVSGDQELASAAASAAANAGARPTKAKLVNSISDENIEALGAEMGHVRLGSEASPSPEMPRSPFGKTRAESSLATTPDMGGQEQRLRALSKQSSFLSSGKSTISSAHSNSLACEVASLSSMTSDYSQFEFANSSAQEKSHAVAAAAAASIKPDPASSVESSGSNSGGLTSFFFSNGLFGSGKKQKQAISSTLASSEDKSVKLVVSSSPAVASAATVAQTPATGALSSRLDSFTNKLLNLKPSNSRSSFNVTSPPPPPPPSNNLSKFFFSSSNKQTSTTPTTTATASATASSKPASPETASPPGSSHHDSASIKSNHSVNNLSSIVAGLQVPNSVLILENRPMNLPAKSQQESLKHQREYEKMVEIAKKKEQREKEMKLRKYEQQMRKEDFMANSLKIWNQEILMNWTELKNAKRTHQLWWHGLPPSIRGKVWRLAIGNELNLTKESYYYYERTAQEKLEILNKLNTSNDLNEEEKRAMSASLEKDKTHESNVELIKLDVSRTFPQLCFFQKDGPYHDVLHSVLGAYACYNTKIGYVQGMSFLTAILLLNMEAPDAFICLANLLNTKYLLACFCMNQAQMNRYFKAHQILLEHNLPKLYRHFEEQKVKPDLYLIEWIFTLFSKSLPLDVVSRVWDVFLRDHEEFLFRTALGILNLYKETLLKMDFIHIVQFLTKLPENINATHLFKSIEQISTTIDETYFTFEHLIGDI